MLMSRFLQTNSAVLVSAGLYPLVVEKEHTDNIFVPDCHAAFNPFLFQATPCITSQGRCWEPRGINSIMVNPSEVNLGNVQE